jgi:hypothetical protein
LRREIRNPKGCAAAATAERELNMTDAETRSDPAITPLIASRIGAGTWTILVVLLSLLAATAVVAYLGWTLGNDADVPASGYVAMALGVIVSLAVGFGLMALVFYSSRKGYDEPPVFAPKETEQDADQSS